jgi:hypothetical protein
MKVLAMEYVTDMYGDCPYTEAFQGSTGTIFPKYDSQESIYKAMLGELETALGQTRCFQTRPNCRHSV